MCLFHGHLVVLLTTQEQIGPKVFLFCFVLVGLRSHWNFIWWKAGSTLKLRLQETRRFVPSSCRAPRWSSAWSVVWTWSSEVHAQTVQTSDMFWKATIISCKMKRNTFNQKSTDSSPALTEQHEFTNSSWHEALQRSVSTHSMCCRWLSATSISFRWTELTTVLCLLKLARTAILNEAGSKSTIRW